MLTPQFWAGKKVLVTGHTGFVGSWLSLLLLLLDARVYGFSRRPHTNPNLFTLLRLENQLENQIFGDVRSFEQLESFCNEVEPDIIIHLAAQALVGPAFHHPLETYETNVLGTLHILECFKKSNAAVLLNVTTDKCYENSEQDHPYCEEDRLGGKEPYSNSKACSELITYAYRHSYLEGRGVATARAGNIIGGGDWSQDRLIPDLIRAFASNRPLSIRCPQATRPWQYILDPVFGYLKLIEKLWGDPRQFSSAWNFGPKEEESKSVEYIVKSLCSRCPVQIIWGQEKEYKESCLLKLDIHKANKWLNWQPQFNLRETLERTLDWYEAYLRGEDMRAFTIHELQNELERHSSLKREIFHATRA